MRYIFFSFILFFTLVACSEASKNSHIEITGIDKTIKPGDNFFKYVNSKWYDSIKIPASQAGVGAYRFMNYSQRIRLKNILDSVSNSRNTFGSVEQIVGDFYASGMDTLTIEKRGFNPIKPILNEINKISDIQSLMGFVNNALKVNNNSIIAIHIGPDIKNSKLNIAHVYQTGIGLPDRDYYFKNDQTTVNIQKAYKTYLARLFELVGNKPEQSEIYAKKVYKIDEEFARSHRTKVELRDVEANYNKMAVKNINERHTNIGWSRLLKDLSVQADSIDIGQPDYYDSLNELLNTVSIQDWKIYLKAKSLINYADVLSTAFVNASFEFNKIVSGQVEPKPRGERITNIVDQYLGEALGRLYVKKYFPEEAKVRMLDLVNNVQKAYATRIDKLKWMNNSTKQKAKEKLFAITKKIGYPDKWKDYKSVHVARDTYFENFVSVNSATFQHNLDKIGKPVDKTEWFTSPSTVTAYYNPTANEIVFPAGILQPPYFDFKADDALNYGGIGMVIGHELTHTFDDQGAQFDKEGNLKNWWTENDYKIFKSKIQQVIDQYNTFTVLDSLHVNGALTVGENTADIAGVAVAYDAFKMTQQGKDSTKIGNFNPDQRFFFSIARIWRVKMREDFLRFWINNDPHSPPIWRVNGPLMNTTPFYNAFNVRPGDKLYLPKGERITIW
ncbi:M13 family metallopeptidase [Marixanthomonas sp. SCSIO 43207]|uniref:M13 family metallopeptidase n=1 Tax=Marixanthomonas sp. SCSIO 43207 TaxID=2779360 RepID=UPI001CA9A203|nr:M13 family metallopeptidase [Marixanthomonas sp. SCSIO 43207]UAB82410.1 M13 family metallopeptidase [Marixanthomonas sp. SCSIO 43207]